MPYNWTEKEIVRFFKESGMDAYGYYDTDITNDSEMENKILHELNTKKRIWAAMPERFPWHEYDGKLALVFSYKNGFGFYFITSLYTKIEIDKEINEMAMCKASDAWTNKVMKMKPDELIDYMKYKIIQVAKKAKQLKMDQIKTCGGEYEV